MAGLISYYVFLALGLIAFALEVWGLVDGIRRPAAAFPYADKRTKVFWLAWLIAGAVIGYLAIPAFWLGDIRLGAGLPWLFMLLAVLPSAIYLADVKPELLNYPRTAGRGPSGRGPRGRGPSGRGPYG